MEGVLDHTLRALLTRVGGIDRCVTEFVRVTDQRLPSRVFYRYCPELHSDGLTPSGVPVYLQLLGGNPAMMAANAQRAAALGAPGIDINFGCPAKQVNRSDGGSVILREPERVFAITRAVREALPAHVPLTVKTRLGYEDASVFPDVVDAVVQAGASELTVHARTKEDGYKPPAFWSHIGAVAPGCPIPIIANGEIWSPEDSRLCRQQSACEDIMLGRGILANPALAQLIKGSAEALAWTQVLELLDEFSVVTEEVYTPRHVGNRVKQWLAYLRRHYREAEDLFERVKRLREPDDIRRAIAADLDKLAA